MQKMLRNPEVFFTSEAQLIQCTMAEGPIALGHLKKLLFQSEFLGIGLLIGGRSPRTPMESPSADIAASFIHHSPSLHYTEAN